jgi:hypothetical protein
MIEWKEIFFEYEILDGLRPPYVMWEDITCVTVRELLFICLPGCPKMGSYNVILFYQKT